MLSTIQKCAGVSSQRSSMGGIARSKATTANGETIASGQITHPAEPRWTRAERSMAKR